MKYGVCFIIKIFLATLAIEFLAFWNSFRCLLFEFQVSQAPTRIPEDAIVQTIAFILLSGYSIIRRISSMLEALSSPNFLTLGRPLLIFFHGIISEVPLFDSCCRVYYFVYVRNFDGSELNEIALKEATKSLRIAAH